jgi:hypothetical protein
VALAAICVHWTVILSLYAANPCGTFWVFAVPAVAGSFALSKYNRSNEMMMLVLA